MQGPAAGHAGIPGQRLYRAAAVRELERRAAERAGLDAAALMERAGAAAFDALCRRWPACRRPLVLCGPGNNGGDGYVLARLARAQGMAPMVIAPGGKEALPAAAGAAARRFTDSGGAVLPWSGAPPGQPDALVDALFGTGLGRAPEGEFARAIQFMNAAGVPVLALDVPSGLDADTGAVPGSTVRADATVTFLALKPGLFTGAGVACAGAIELAGLGVDPALAQDIEAAAVRVAHASLPFPLARRSRAAHKGDCGHVLVVGGDHGYAGAPFMAGTAAARTGSGLVTLATRQEHAGLQALARPELMVHGIAEARELDPLLRRANVVAIGPGLGVSQWSAQLLARVLESELPLVVDADALNLLARDPARRDGWVLTPHPGEAARLLGSVAAEIQRDRLAAARSLQARYGGTAVLKGAGTLVARDHLTIAVCTDGNPGMASGGMGDVLTGVIAGLIAQGVETGVAALAGVCLHGAAADQAAAAGGERGLLAGDLMPWLRRLANPAD
jgi:NAD(P)H-hydrate epimerase